MKFSKWISIVIGIIFVGSFIFGIQVSSEPNHSELNQVDETANSVSEGDHLFAAWVSNNSGFQKPSNKELKNNLTPIQFDVTQKEGTERPFKNEYWDNKKTGIYVDIVSGEPLFSSTDKFKSGTGWPSFTRAISEHSIATKADLSLFGIRTELRSSIGDSHLGHVFDDGPAPTGKRYCINSASLRFISKEKLETEGYGEFAALFTKE